ncbi:general stress protein [Methylobacterium sp. 77]|uniref:general stress protein n=1 Tax=Methylobacterium sp. 77 TaxID=1101192 RepID=UPI000370F687|nr:general stress protein [Methylobacterium sp. 77]
MAHQTITALYDSYDDASNAVAKLESSGISHSDISIVSSNENDRHSGRLASTDTTRRHTTETAETASTGAGTGAGVGTLLGGAAGLLTGLGLLAIPGVGPVVAAGWLVTTLTGAGIGAAAGGLVGGLTGAGLSEADAHTYSEGVRRGGTLVTVKVDDARASHVMDVLEEHGSVNVTERAEGWKADGWTAPSATPSDTATLPGARPGVRSYPTGPL